MIKRKWKIIKRERERERVKGTRESGNVMRAARKLTKNMEKNFPLETIVQTKQESSVTDTNKHSSMQSTELFLSVFNFL